MTNPTSQALERQKSGPEALIEQYRGDFALVLPSHVKPDQFMRLGQAFIRRADDRVKEVAKRNPGSFLSALLDCARYGLEPGDTYHFVPFGNAIQGIRDYKGEIELMHRTGRVVNVVASVVRANDEWHWEEGVTARPHHRRAGTSGPMLAGDWVRADRGELVIVYAYAELLGGATSKVVVLEEPDVMKSKAKSKTASRSDSIWNTNPEDAWIKTAIHRLWKWVPKSAEFMGEMARGATQLAAVVESNGLPLPAHDTPEYGALDDEPDLPPAATAAEDDEIAEAEIVDDDEHPPASIADDPDGLIGTDDLRTLRNAYREHAITGAKQVAHATEVLGHEVTSLNDLTGAEGRKLVDALAGA